MKLLQEEKFRLEKEIQQLQKEQRNQSEEWKQFQSDLQMAVMIANDMKAGQCMLQMVTFIKFFISKLLLLPNW